MTRGLSRHLSEEALDDVLIGLGSAESESHLARCAECRFKIEQFGADVDLFNKASMAWSEAQPARAVRPARMTPKLRMPVAFAGSVAAVILAIAVAVSVWHHEHSFVANDGGGNDQPAVDSQAQIAQDNELMQAVDAAISPQEESPIDEYDLSESPRKHWKTRPK